MRARKHVELATRGSPPRVEQAWMELSLPFPHRSEIEGISDRPAPSGRAPRRPTWVTRAGYALDWLRHDRLALRAALCALVGVGLLGGGWLWLRDSSLVAIRHVHITGVHGVDALEIREALDNAASRMTTMDFHAAALRSAVSSFAVVGSLRATTSFPHTVSISVTERPPVAALLSAGQRTAVAADGTVLGPASLSSSLPVVNGSVEPPAGARLHESASLAAVAVLGAAPAALAPFVVRAFDGPEGLTVAMRNGLLVYFGDSTRPHAKWLSLARVLTSPSTAGAWYVDVRLPERPAAGLSSSSSTSTPVEAGASDPTAAALAATLAKAAGGSVGASSTPATTSGTGIGEASSQTSEASESGGSEASSTSAGSTASSPPSGSTEATTTSSGGPSSTPTPGG
jgi:cell division protein FtsQ